MAEVRTWSRRFKNIFRKKEPFTVEEGHVIIPAFVSGGIQYYQLKDIFNTFVARAMDAFSLYEQWDQRCTRTFLLGHTKAIDAIIREPKKIDIIDIAELNNKLKERLEWAIPSEELIYKFAAVAYFDRNESPYRYDEKYGEEKIARWKKDNNIDAFFLKMPIKDSIPSIDMSSTDLKNYLNTLNKMSRNQYEKVISILSSSPQNKDLLIKLQSEKNLISTR